MKVKEFTNWEYLERFLEENKGIDIVSITPIQGDKLESDGRTSRRIGDLDYIVRKCIWYVLIYKP